MMEQAQFVLIRGLLRDARHWGLFEPLLRQHFANIPVWTPDIPGNGKLNRQTSPRIIADMTEALREQIPLRKNLRLIAISMGGMMAIDWMTRYPDEVQSAVLINTSLRNLSPFYHRLRWTAYPRIVKMILTALVRRAIDIEADILALTSNHHARDRALLQQWRHWQQQHPIALTNAVNQCAAAVKFSNPLQLPHPILVIASTADRLVDYRCSSQLARELDADYRRHDTAGHDLPLDQPGWLVNVIDNWLRQTMR